VLLHRAAANGVKWCWTHHGLHMRVEYTVHRRYCMKVNMASNVLPPSLHQHARAKGAANGLQPTQGKEQQIVGGRQAGKLARAHLPGE